MSAGSGAPTATREAATAREAATTTARTATSAGADRSSTARARADADARAEARSVTPTWRQRLRSGRLWIMVALVALLTVGVSVLLQGATTSGTTPPLDPTSPRPNGAKALVSVLGQHGVDVTVANSLHEVREATGPTARGTTIVLHQRDVQLTAAQLTELRELGADRIVLIHPGPAVLADLGSGIVASGAYQDDPATPIEAGAACADPVARNAPAISNLGGALYTAPDAPGASNCYVVNDRTALAIEQVGDTSIVALGAAVDLTNEHILLQDNGAMAIGLLGDSERLVWYVPGADDLASTDGVPPIGDLVPAWVTPVMLLAVATGVAAMVWRGRRFGPLVTERLPVVVPASETMDGRARLYARSGSRLRALDNLRMGTIGRLARAHALPPAAPAHEVAVAVAQTTARPRDEVVAVLIEAVPATDGELVELSDHVLRLEHACLDALAVPSAHDAPRASGRPTDPEPDRGDA